MHMHMRKPRRQCAMWMTSGVARSREAGGGSFQGSGSACSSQQVDCGLEPFVDALPLPAVLQPMVPEKPKGRAWTKWFSESIEQLAEQDDKVVAIAKVVVPSADDEGDG